MQSGRVTFRPVSKLRFPNPKRRVVKGGPTSNEAFAKLKNASFAVYGTGTVLHSDPELSESGVAVTVDLATSDAVYAAQELSGFADELGRPIVERLPAGSGRAHARSVKLDPPDAAGEVETGEPAVSTAPPTDRPVVQENQADLTPVLKADLLRAEAAARAVSTGCVIGDDLAWAAASADDTDVGDVDFDPESTKPLLSLSADEPGRAVSHSKSRTYLVPIEGVPGRFGAVSELRQTIAPVTFGIPGSDEKFTIEVGGEWVMRAASDGAKGTVWFGAENTEDGDRPAIRLIQGDTVVDEVGLREAGGRTGIFIDGDPVGEIRIGGEPRAVLGDPESDPTQTPTRVSAAADVVVVRIFEPQAELRVGHMEVGLAVPPGGVQCPGIKLTKTSEPASVRPGDAFAWNLEVSNPNDCQLDEVKVVDTPSATPGVDWRAVTSVPRATRTSDGSLVFEGIGAIDTGAVKPLRLNAQVEPGSALGEITNRAAATGTCGDALVVGAAETRTAVGMTVVPALPRPAPGLAASDDPVRGNPGSGSQESASGPVVSSTSATRAASATRPASATRSASTSGPKVSPQTDQARTHSAPLARSGGETAPYVALALGLLAAGRFLRLARVRRRLN